MSETVSRMLDFTRGANTSATGITAQPAWREFNEAYVDGGGNRRRLGKVKLYQFPVTARIVDFDGADDVISLSAFALDTVLGLRWTMEVLFQTDSIASNRSVLGGATNSAIKVVHTTTSTVTVTIKDSAGTNVTLTFTGVAAGTVCALMVTRNGAALVGILNGVTVTGTMHATNLLGNAAFGIGAVNAAAFFDGGVCFLRFLSTVETVQRSGWIRLPDPRADNVIADWIVTLDSNGYCLDRSKNEYHGTSTGSPASTRVPLAYNPDPVMAVAHNINKSGQRQLYVSVGDRVYPAVV